jgi:ubiquinone/menaquinone biosynthesis C-methylase UbiE
MDDAAQTSDRLFAEAAAYYHFRAPYAPAALEYIRETLRLDLDSRALDLGCGPGTISIPLARMVGEVLAVDPSREMIAEGRARAARCHNITWLCARAEEISEDLGPFTVATVGQAFHWMDRDRVLRKLERMLDEERGALVLINPGKRRPQESWETTVNPLVARYLGVRSRHPQMHAEPEHEPALLRSRTFSQFSTREFSLQIERGIASIIGYVYSTSTSPRSAFGERAAQFERELTEALLANQTSGVFKEEVATEVLIARRCRT